MKYFRELCRSRTQEDIYKIKLIIRFDLNLYIITELIIVILNFICRILFNLEETATRTEDGLRLYDISNRIQYDRRHSQITQSKTKFKAEKLPEYIKMLKILCLLSGHLGLLFIPL